MNNSTVKYDKYSALYRDNIERISSGSSQYINSFRESAIREFVRLGIPTRKNESYRYTNLDPFFSHDYSNYFIPGEQDFIRAEEFRCDVT
ncbi:MAG TPA: hypothetical protein PLO24_13850, partial [Bacteroidales bacterium]|nr:hypothetical protein [Bacteroidales bacterium]